MTISNSRVFIDTNILFYANDPASVFGAQAIARINEFASLNNEMVISGQTIREYAAVTLRNTVYHKLDLQASIAVVLRNIARFQRDFEVLHDSPDVLQNWLSFLPLLKTGKDVFDFNITATLKANGIHNILTHNEKDFAIFGNWLTVLPSDCEKNPLHPFAIHPNELSLSHRRPAASPTKTAWPTEPDKTANNSASLPPRWTK